jgi:hypothetical protein
MSPLLQFNPELLLIPRTCTVAVVNPSVKPSDKVIYKLQLPLYKYLFTVIYYMPINFEA